MDLATHLWFAASHTQCENEAREIPATTKKLTPEHVRKINELRAGGMSQTEIAKRFGVHQTAISYVTRKNRNVHVGNS